MKSSLRAFRSQFPVLDQKISGKRLIYLDSACTALKSKAVAEAVSRFYTESGICGGKRSTHLLAQGVEEMISRSRQAAARFINAASPNEIIFTSGTTEAFNLLAGTLDFEERNEVVITDLEHNAVFLPFHELEQRGKIRLRICPTENGVLDLGRLAGLITEKTALVAMTQASNVYGGVMPVTQAARLAHAKGALIAVDAAQYAATHAQDVQATNVDFAAFSAHKLGGAFGVGILYGKEHLLNGLGRFKTGGGTLKSLAPAQDGGWDVRYLDAPMKFEAGVGNYAGLMGLIPAFDTLLSLGFDVLRAHTGSLIASLFEKLSKTEGIRILGEPENLIQGALVSFTFTNPALSAVDFNLYLNHQIAGRFFALRTGEHCAHLLHASKKMKETVRVSFFGYNTQEEIKLFHAALESFLKEALKVKKAAAIR